MKSFLGAPQKKIPPTVIFLRGVPDDPKGLFLPSKNGLFLRVETFESSQKCPEILDCFLSQTTNFLINPFTRRFTLTNFQGEGNNAVCLRVGNCEKMARQPAKKKNQY